MLEVTPTRQLCSGCDESSVTNLHRMAHDRLARSSAVEQTGEVGLGVANPLTRRG
jgi:hypothetical protein